jgi:hypothetical protein
VLRAGSLLEAIPRSVGFRQPRDAVGPRALTLDGKWPAATGRVFVPGPQRLLRRNLARQRAVAK